MLEFCFVAILTCFVSMRLLTILRIEIWLWNQKRLRATALDFTLPLTSYIFFHLTLTLTAKHFFIVYVDAYGVIIFSMRVHHCLQIRKSFDDVINLCIDVS